MSNTILYLEKCGAKIQNKFHSAKIRIEKALRGLLAFGAVVVSEGALAYGFVVVKIIDNSGLFLRMFAKADI